MTSTTPSTQPTPAVLDDAPVLAHAVRGGFVESVHRASVAVTAADGSVELELGSATDPVFPRSSNKPVQALATGTRGYVALAKTPFYVESGGQVSDAGRIFGATTEATVERMVKQGGNRPRLHLVRTEQGTLAAGEIVTAEVIDAVRDATRCNHTATHLLHAALRQVLGPHVKQAGSLVAPYRLRFDFVHFSGVSGTSHPPPPPIPTSPSPSLSI